MTPEDFPLQVRRTKAGYSVEAIGLGVKKTGKNLVQLEQEMYAALPEIIALMARYGLESNAVEVKTSPVVSRRKAVVRSNSRIEDKIQHGAMLVLVMLLISTPVVMAVNHLKSWRPDIESMKTDLRRITPDLDDVTPDLGAITPSVVSLTPNLSISDAIAERPWAIYSSQAIKKTADIIESIQPDRRDEVVYNLGRIAVALKPYAEQMRPIWLACCTENMDDEVNAPKSKSSP
jgi:hypothetical protein